MSKTLVLLLTVALFGLGAPQDDFGPKVGSEAPDFTLKDSQGKTYQLSDYRGQLVVLEFIRSGGW